MTPERWSSGARETAIARQLPCKQAAIPEPSLGNESASNSGWTVGGDVFCAVRALAVWEGGLDKPRGSAVYSESMRLAWDGRQPEPGSRGTFDVGSRYRATWLRTLVCVWWWFVRCSLELYKSPINPIINPKPVYSHSIPWKYLLEHLSHSNNNRNSNNGSNSVQLLIYLRAYSTTQRPVNSTAKKANSIVIIITIIQFNSFIWVPANSE
jgi:hypothetical protein